MVIAAPEDSIQYTDAIEIPQTVWITDSTIDNGPQTINLPVMEIDENAFRGTIIEAIFIATAGKIGNNAFRNCSNLKAIMFHGSFFGLYRQKELRFAGFLLFKSLFLS
jgi:hypothetical protein